MLQHDVISKILFVNRAQVDQGQASLFILKLRLSSDKKKKNLINLIGD